MLALTVAVEVLAQTFQFSVEVTHIHLILFDMLLIPLSILKWIQPGIQTNLNVNEFIIIN